MHYRPRCWRSCRAAVPIFSAAIKLEREHAGQKIDQYASVWRSVVDASASSGKHGSFQDVRAHGHQCRSDSAPPAFARRKSAPHRRERIATRLNGPPWRILNPSDCALPNGREKSPKGYQRLVNPEGKRPALAAHSYTNDTYPESILIQDRAQYLISMWSNHTI